MPSTAQTWRSRALYRIQRHLAERLVGKRHQYAAMDDAPVVDMTPVGKKPEAPIRQDKSGLIHRWTQIYADHEFSQRGFPPPKAVRPISICVNLRPSVDKNS